MKIHSFHIDVAKNVGLGKAVILYNLDFWIKKNMANNMHEHDGAYWTYNSSTAFGKLFPYLNSNTIRKWLIDLEDEGYILSANYNKTGFDRTKWYTLTNKYYSIVQSEQSGVTSEHPIPDRKPYEEIIQMYFQGLSNKELIEIKEAFPNVDIHRELKQAKLWLLSNTHRKKKNLKRFINSWLTKANRKLVYVLDGKNKYYRANDYPYDANQASRLGWCSSCKKSDFYDKFNVHNEDSRCCNAKLLPSKEK